MKTGSILFLSPTRIALATIGMIVLGIALAPAQKEDPAGRKNRLADAALAEVPAKASARSNPFEGDAEAVAAGGKLFEQHCSDCHGKKGGGTRHGVSLLREEVQQATPGTLFWIVTNGVVRHGMPVWSKLPEPERWQIVSFVESLKSRPIKSEAGQSQPGNPPSPKPAFP